MMNSNQKMDYENINGVTLSLKVDTPNGATNSRLFTISYKSKPNKSSWPKASLFLAILFNMIAIFYIRISLTAIVVIIVVLSFLVFFWITHSVQSEILLVIPTVGIQSSVKYVYGREDHFVPWSSVDDVIINEVIKMNRVLYFLTVLVKTSNQESESLKLMPLFKYTKPRLAMLEIIYSELQRLLTETHCPEPEKAAGDMG
ncbi:phosphatidylinositol N-acetylglucosaminyltransferase subunit H-like [Ostrinia nubilalis]|uniref:phosphatidylinositol N-acetylglucosaminyltransferase subunit H-like n=1 Tax=Ostrinia furnacalis TaxID=93504 RepID=UPI00103FE216|nr:phosphatidylinositol N-acetylglucosaminyltransferase subunit H-like [Ostrinia furnacalis]